MAATTIPALFESAVAEAGDHVWLRTDAGQWTYGEAHERILAAAGALAQRGAGRGEIVLATTHNTPDHLFMWLGLMVLGAIFVPVNPRSSEAELAALVEQVTPKLVLGDAEVAALAQAPAAAPQPAGPAHPDDPAVLIPTSGTTGRSKLVTQTQRAYAMAGEGFPWWMELDSDDRLMTSLPLFHINAPAYSVLGSVAARAGLVLLERFSASTFLQSARRHGATEFNSIGAMLEILMRQPERRDDADTPLRLCYTGPSPTRERQLEIERRLGLRIVCGYALSETPYGMIWARGTRPYGTLGSPRQHPSLGTINEARVIGDGVAVGAGEVGELQLRNPVVMRGYWGLPEETERVLLPGGWLRTACMSSRRARASSGRTCGCWGSSPTCTRRRRAARCRSTARASPARRSPTWASRPTSCAASRWSPGSPASSVTSPRRWSSRSGSSSTATSSSARSTSRRASLRCACPDG
ncbi:N/A [soil metagenome]